MLKTKSRKRKPGKRQLKNPGVATAQRIRLRQRELERRPGRPDLWTIQELAGRYACSPWTIRKWIAEGKLARVFIGPHMPRIPDASVQRLESEAPSTFSY